MGNILPGGKNEDWSPSKVNAVEMNAHHLLQHRHWRYLFSYTYMISMNLKSCVVYLCWHGICTVSFLFCKCMMCTNPWYFSLFIFFGRQHMLLFRLDAVFYFYERGIMKRHRHVLSELVRTSDLCKNNK